MRNDRYNFDHKDLLRIRTEAVIFEQLSAAPLVIDIYGYCGGTVVLEAMAKDLHKMIIYDDGQFDQKRLDAMPDPSLNNFTASEKLQISLEMAESLASMHGHPGGQTVHCDTHIEQWLLDSRGQARLNDFNNAWIMDWNTETHDYCLRSATYGGIVRHCFLCM